MYYYTMIAFIVKLLRIESENLGKRGVAKPVLKSRVCFIVSHPLLERLIQKKKVPAELRQTYINNLTSNELAFTPE